jgi:hypothetical protein
MLWIGAIRHQRVAMCSYVMCDAAYLVAVIGVLLTSRKEESES